MINPYQAKYFAYELSKKASADNREKFGATLMDAKVELNPHQVEAALFAFKSPYSKGAILADEVGLGKTIEAGLLLSQKWAENKRRILIICPSSIRKQWANELADKFYLKAEILETPSFNKKVRSGIINPFDGRETIKICSYQFARRKAEEIQLTSWDLVVIDEAHYLRNVYRPSNVTAKAIAHATRDYKKVLLTATPLQNRLDEVYGLISVIDPTIFGDIKTFRRNYVLESGAQDVEGLRDRLSSVVHRTLRRDVREFVHFRERIPVTQQFTPTEEEQELYDNVLDYLRQESIYAFPTAQKHLLQTVIFKLLGSSSFAVARTLEALIRRLKKILEESKVIDNELYTLFFEEYENLDDELDETEEEDEEESEITLEDKLAIEEEIKKLESFLLLANSIEHNEKGEKLLVALDKGFEKLKELGARQKALIFTESTRTQKYLFERLSKEKYAGRILLFNGSNNDEVSKEIYHQWKDDENNAGKITAGLILDYFAGSGTTGHATIKLNRNDGKKRKYILIEMGTYFDTVTKPRIQKVIYSDNWKNGKPQDTEGISQMFKYQVLESYEDVLNNLKLSENKMELFEGEAQEEYLLKYMLDIESRDHLFDISIFKNPFNYQLNITKNNELLSTKIDLAETFNYLIGLYVERIQRRGDIKFVEGTTRQGEKTLIIWRNTETVSDVETQKQFRKLYESARTQEFDQIYINGDHHFTNFRIDPERFKVKMIEQEFFKLMFEE